MRPASRALAVTGAVVVCGATAFAASAATGGGSTSHGGGRPITTVLGHGSHQLVVRIAQDAYRGNARYTVAVGGQQQGRELVASAGHGSGRTDRVVLRGDWTGTEQVTVRFVNDAYDGDSAHDRNLYVESASFDGTSLPGAARALYGWNWEATFSFGPSSTAPTPTPTASDPSPNPSEPSPSPTQSSPSASDPSPTPSEPAPSTSDPAPTSSQPEQPPAAGSFHESFDSGIGALAHAWGDTSKINTSVPGQITLSGTSGAMEWPSGPTAGHGYGTFSFTAKLSGNKPGPALVLWPSNDQWPGQEFDLGEINTDGVPYLTTHWKGADGGDAFSAHTVDGLDESQWHTYALRWEPGKLTYTVDGTVIGTDTAHVPADAAHGGINDVMGVMNRPGDDTSLTVTDAGWTPLS